jgi:hypothetical protein
MAKPIVIKTETIQAWIVQPTDDGHSRARCDQYPVTAERDWNRDSAEFLVLILDVVVRRFVAHAHQPECVGVMLHNPAHIPLLVDDWPGGFVVGAGEGEEGIGAVRAVVMAGAVLPHTVIVVRPCNANEALAG